MPLDLLDRLWWPSPYLHGRTTPANRFTTRLRNAWRRRRGLPELPDAEALQRARSELLRAMTLAYPPGPNDCPHAPLCSKATACHVGSVSRHEAREVLERDGWWYAAAWQRRGPGGPMHRPAPGAEPRLERPPLWIERGRVAASIGGDGTALLDVVLEECAAAGVVAVRAMREGRDLVVVAAGLSREETIALDDRLRDRVTKGAGVRVQRAVIQRGGPVEFARRPR